MKKRQKIFFITTGLILLVVIAVLYYSISSIDKTPYFLTEYYSNTIERLNLQLSARKIADSKLYSGFAKINITPTIAECKQEPDKRKFNSIRLASYRDGACPVCTIKSLRYSRERNCNIGK